MVQFLPAVTPDVLGHKTCTAGLLARGSLGFSGLPEPCGPVADRSPSPLTVAGAAGVLGRATARTPPIPIMLRRFAPRRAPCLSCLPLSPAARQGAKGGRDGHDG